MHLRRSSWVSWVSPALITFCFALLVPPLRAAGRRQPLFTTDADPAFVLRLAFRVARPSGTTRLALEGPNGKPGYRLELGPASLVLTEVGGAGRRLGECPARWGRQSTLLLVRRKSLLRVALDGRIVIEASQASRAIACVAIQDPEGRLRLLDEPRYQPCEEIRLSDDFMMTPDSPSRWEPLSGTWHVAGVSRPRSASDPFKLVGFASGEGVALSSESYWFWSDYRASVSVRLTGSGSGAGILFGCEGRDRCYGFSWGGPAAGGGIANRLRLWHREGKQVRVLAERPAYARPGQWYRLSVETRGGRITVRVDENPVLTAGDPGLLGGQCGLWVSGKGGAEFDDWSVCNSECADEPLAVASEQAPAAPDREFADDPYMSSWGSVSADWEGAQQGGQRWCWHRAVLFGDAVLQVTASGLPPVAEMVLLGDPGSAESGYRVTVASGKVVLRRAGRAVAAAPATAAPTVLEVRGKRIRVLAGERRLLEYLDPAPIQHGRIGVRFSRPVSLGGVARGVRVTSGRLAEYRFDAAPVDWAIESGEWVATTRWACVPHWNFFGGRGQPMATLWNKRRFGGDQWIEAFIAPREGTSDRMHFAWPINLNLSFCAAGETTGSGYSLVYRSHDEPALLYRKGKVVAVNRDIVLPRWRDDQTFVYYRITQTWHHFEILREGGRIRIWVEVPSHGAARLERRLLFDYTDPEPLPGDRLGLWTWGENGMAIARVRVAAARRLGPAAPLLSPQGSLTGSGTRANPINGGSFRIELSRGPLDPGRSPVVAFDYRADPNVALALYAAAGGQRFRARFLGDVTQDADSIPMGTVRRVPGSGGWVHAEFPLLQALRAFFPTGKLPRVDQLFLANLDTRPDRVGGLSVNPRGARFEWRAAGVPYSRGVPFRLVGPEGEGLPAGEVRVALLDAALDPAQCRLTLQGQALAAGSPGLRWDGTRREWVVRVADAGMRFGDGESVTLCVAPPGKGSALSLRWRARTADDKVPPAAPVVTTALGPDRVETFETGMGAWRRLGGEQGATLWRDESTCAGGRYSLRLYHRRVAGSFAAALCEKPFDVRRWPVMTFSYRVPPQVQVSLVAEIEGRWYEIAFTDGDHTFPVVGSAAGVQRDGRWHQAEADLAAAARASGSGATIISKLFFADAGWMNNLNDVAWHVDDVRFVPALPVGQAKTITWSATDASGIGGFSWAFDGAADTVPDTQEEPSTEGVAVPAGASYFHVRARDGAGNWGPAAHFRFVPVEPGAASAVEARPAAVPGERLAAPAVEVALAHADSVDVESVRWTVSAGGRTQSDDLAGPHLRWDRAKGTLAWGDPSLAQGRPAPITCRLTASDIAGRRVVDQEWRWVVEPALDKEPPAAPFVSYVPANRLSRSDFEAGMPPDVELRRSAWMLHDTASAAVGKGCVRVVNLEGDDFFASFLRKGPYAVHAYPRVGFDYRFERDGCNLNVVSVVNGDLQTVGFAGENGGYPVFVQNSIGRIAAVRQDGRWRHAEFDFGAMLRKRYPDVPRFFADYLGTWSTGRYSAYDNPAGASLWLDNITLFSPQASSAGFEWQPPEDANGIGGYSYAVDHQADTLPDERQDTREPQCHLRGLAPGAWVFHVRACDGAGNWGPAAHVPFELTK